MTPPLASIYFSVFPVNSQVFYRTALSFAIVNLKPLLPGHILVCPYRVVPRIHDLRPDEVSDLFLTVQKLGAALGKIYKAEGLNIAIQDGQVAGQSVPHVHAHIIPRHKDDLPSDEIYKLLESDDANLERAHEQKIGIDTPSTRLLAQGLSKDQVKKLREELLKSRGKFPAVKPDTERLPRTEEEMRQEAEWLAAQIEELEGQGRLTIQN